MRKIETLILNNLIHNEEFTRHVIPFVESDYFHQPAEKEVFGQIKDFFLQYGKVPEYSILEIEFEQKKIKEGLYKNVKEVLVDIKEGEAVDYDWLIANTEKFCRDKAIHNAIVKSIKILDGEETNLTEAALPSLLQDALAVSFDKSVGHDFYEDSEDRYDFFHKDEFRFKFDLDMFNKITKGGIPAKTLNMILAGCVHPDTKVKVRIRKRISSMWEEKEIAIGDIKNLLNNYDIEITSEDGWVPIAEFVDKGKWDEYLLTTSSGLQVSCNENHLFETVNGWEFAKNIINKTDIEVVTVNGLEKCSVIKTGETVPIVDVVIDHPNHRYYTNNISSHNTNVGKSLFLCHMAACYIKMGYDVLYITLEMAEEWLAQRIDCNLMDISIDTHLKMSKSTYTSKLADLEAKTHGKLIIKEYPTSSAHVGHFRALLNDLSIKKNFKPKVILIDYLNICSSQRAGKNDNSYTIVKKTAEELRALGQEFNVPIWSATQTNRGGYGNTDVSMTDTSESFGLPMTADFLFAMVRTEELDAMNQLLCIQLKSRYGRADLNKKFVVGVDIDKFKLFDVEQGAQADLDDGPAFDKSKFGTRMKTEGYSDLDFS